MRELPDDDSWTIERRRAIGARVRAARTAQNLTQERLHLACRIDRVTLQRIEAGEDALITTLLRIAWVLDMPLADLVRETEPRPATTGDVDRPGR
ncbi:helix-turn-helix domain-containing protein [Streptomyces sp. NPDC050509]|uniref:helix-turn-helix domain-containing protein n=1 Tax=Streptomyces sp. NPDC050509 TaxID=3365620 RepID=UPI0037B70FA2